MTSDKPDQPEDPSSTVPRRGDQTQGGISHAVAEQARAGAAPTTAAADTPPRGHRARRRSLDEGDDGTEAYGLRGDDGGHVPAGEPDKRAPLMPDQAKK